MNLSASVNQQAIQFPNNMLPTMNGFYQGDKSFTHPSSQPRMEQMSRERNQALTRLRRDHMWHPGMNYTQPAPTFNGTYQGFTSIPSASQPLVALPSTDGNQALTRLQQDQSLHSRIQITPQSSTMQNLAPQTSSTSQSAAIPIYQVASASTSSWSISAAIHAGDRPQEIPKALLNDVGYEESGPFSKRIKHESGAVYKPDGINFPNSVITELSEYTK